MVGFTGIVGRRSYCFLNTWDAGVYHGGISIKMIGVTVLAFIYGGIPEIGSVVRMENGETETT